MPTFHAHREPAELPDHVTPPRLPSPAALATAALIAAAAAAAKFGTVMSSPLVAAASVVLAALLVILSAVDFESYRLPDAMTLPLTALGLVVTWLTGEEALIWHGLAAGVAFAMFFAVAALYRYRTNRHGLGLGDAKLFAASGAWLGPAGLPSVLFLASASALILAGAAKLTGREVSGATKVPFGPFLALGTWIVWLYGPMI